MLGKPFYYNLLRFIAIIFITSGILFRFVNLDQKYYYADEAFTSLRISGYSLQEVAQEVYTSQVISVENFQKYQHLNSTKGLGGTVQGLITEEPQLTPLYFIMVRLWSQLFGTSITAIRSFSAVLSTLALVAMYWLCLELFKSRLAAWIGTALIAVSPFHVLYSQEARPYSLLTLTTLLSGVFVLRSLERSTRLNWGIYTASIIFGFYSHLFSAFAVLSHGIYIFVSERFRISKPLISYLLALTFGVITFTPWLLGVFTHRHQVQNMTNWSGIKISALDLIKVWAGNISRLFLDLGFRSSLEPSKITLSFITSVLLLLFLVVYALYFTYRRAPQKSWLFIAFQIGVTAFLLYLPDLFFGRRTSTSATYSIALFLGIQLAATYLFYKKITLSNFTSKEFVLFKCKYKNLLDPPHNYLRKRLLITPMSFWSLIITGVFMCSIISCLISIPAQVWWNKDDTHAGHIHKTATIINQSPSPLIVAITEHDSDLMRVESLAHLLKPETQLQFFSLNSFLNDSLKSLNTSHDTFIYLTSKPSPMMAEQFQQKLKRLDRGVLEPLSGTDNRVFKLKI